MTESKPIITVKRIIIKLDPDAVLAAGYIPESTLTSERSQWAEEKEGLETLHAERIEFAKQIIASRDAGAAEDAARITAAEARASKLEAELALLHQAYDAEVTLRKEVEQERDVGYRFLSAWQKWSAALQHELSLFPTDALPDDTKSRTLIGGLVERTVAAEKATAGAKQRAEFLDGQRNRALAGRNREETAKRKALEELKVIREAIDLKVTSHDERGDPSPPDNYTVELRIAGELFTPNWYSFTSKEKAEARRDKVAKVFAVPPPAVKEPASARQQDGTCRHERGHPAQICLLAPGHNGAHQYFSPVEPRPATSEVEPFGFKELARSFIPDTADAASRAVILAAIKASISVTHECGTRDATLGEYARTFGHDPTACGYTVHFRAGSEMRRPTCRSCKIALGLTKVRPVRNKKLG